MARDSPRRDREYSYRQDRDRDRDRDRERQRRRRGHRATDSAGELLPPASRARDSASESPSPTKRHSRAAASSSRSSNPLSVESLAKLDKTNAKQGWRNYDAEYVKRVRQEETKLERERRKEEERERHRDRELEQERRRQYESDFEAERIRNVRAARASEERRRRHTDDEREDRRRLYTDEEREERRRRKRESRQDRQSRGDYGTPSKRKSRVVSGPLLEEGGNDLFYEQVAEKRGGGGSEYTDEERARKKRKRIWIAVGIIVVLLAIIIPVAVVVSGKKSSHSGDTPAAASSTTPANSNLKGISESDIPASARGGILDPFTWYDTDDFNVTYTDVTVGGLPIMGLNSTWDDSVQANPNVPALDKAWEYGKMPIRGMNIGGWLSLEPFITPSFFSGYSTRENVIDEWTLTQSLGSTRAAQTLEKHYSSFITKQTFVDIRAAGFDHVRFPFSYWAVTTYDGDPYVPRISWRYLLRAIEYARWNGLRVNLDLHGVPGSQNGWNHSGRQGVIGFLNGTDGELNGQRTLDIHNQLSQFFAQPRYKNVVTMYGLMNEPRMVDLDTDTMLAWYDKAIPMIRKNNITGIIVFGDGFMGLDNWQGKLQNYDNLLLDVHQYVIFNTDQIVLQHSDKLNFACKAWTAQTLRSSNTATGFGPTLTGEWSQADTDCTENLNNVGVGSRWEGTYNTGNASTSVLTPTCPTKNNPQCECADANADPSQYSDAYKQWLLQFAEAQMQSFEEGWGWFYWTWTTESAPQWSWQAGMQAGILPKLAYQRAFNCSGTVPDYGKLGLPENY